MSFTYYAKRENLISIHEHEAAALNEEGWDIFWVPQEFPHGVRTKENLISLRYVCADFDKISLGEFEEKFLWYPKPSMLVQTRSGFHAYWKLAEPIAVFEGLSDVYREFVEQRLVPLGADGNAKDVSRLLRPPMFRYWRDSKGNQYNDVFVQIVKESSAVYDWDQLCRFFPKIHTFQDQQEKRMPPRRTTFNAVESKSSKRFWVAANDLNAKEAILELSGSSHVLGEAYTFRKDSAGERIYVNGKATNAWIDKQGKIGSTENAGPTIVNWLKYYGHDDAKIANILKEVFKIKGE